jgi:hypothetical protein
MNSIASPIGRTLQRHQDLLIIVGVVLVALPFVALSCYNHPSLDDILDAVTVRRLGFWAAQRHFYFTHTGRYATTVLLALINPLVYVRLETNWWPVAVGFIVGTLFVLRFLLSAVGFRTGNAWRGAGVLLGLWLAYAPGQAEGLYWFTGAYTYVVSAWLLLLWACTLARYAAARQKQGQHTWGWAIALVILTVAVAGTTEPVAFPFLLALLVGAGLSWWWDFGRLLIGLAVLATVGCAVSFAAPGNFVRMGAMGESFGVVKSLFYAGGVTGYLLMTWVGNPVLLAISGLVLPGLARMAQRREELVVALLARVPAGILATALSSLLAAASCPAYHASGTGLPPRVRTTLYLLFVVGWFGVLLTWCCRQVCKEQPSPVWVVLTRGNLMPLWMALLGLFFLSDYNVQTRATMLGQGSNNVVRAYRQWLSGDAARYDAEVRARYRTLAMGRPVVNIKPLQNRPELLYCFDIAGMTNTVFLRDYAYYFGVQQVRTTAQAPETAPKP